MKKLIILVLSVFIFAACSKGLEPVEIDRKLSDSVEKTMQARGVSNVNVSVERLKKLDSPEGFYFYKVVVSDGRSSQDQYFFFDGSYIVSDFMGINGSSMAKDLMFEYVKADIDVSNLSLIYGNRDAKNVIVKITDFECPYCREANRYIEEKIKERGDVAVYIAHFPLRIHPNAVMDAKIFEAGLLVGMNFAHELFTNNSLLEMSEDRLIEHFVKLVDEQDRPKFKEFIESEQVGLKLVEGQKTAREHGVNSTPTMFINGKKIDGFDPQLVDRAFGEFK